MAWKELNTHTPTSWKKKKANKQNRTVKNVKKKKKPLWAISKIPVAKKNLPF